jgi:hypothetical protein
LVLFGYILLAIGALCVGFRVYLCQAQAYAIIALSIITMIITLLHNAHRRDSIVEIKKNVYCADLANTSHIAVTPGRLSGDVTSSYERLYFTRIRVWLPLIIWLAWIAYGTLFHSGKHADHTEHELLIDLASVGNETPALLRTGRLYTLALCGLASTLLTQYFRRNPSSTIVAMSNTEKTLQCILWLVFGALLFFPAIESTAQALLPLRLIARTSFFYTLFILNENLNRLVHYERWLCCYQPFTQAILVAIQIALGRAKPMRLSEDKAKELALKIDKMAPPPPMPELKRPNSSELLSSELVNYCAVLQSAWVLVAGDSIYPLAFLQVVFVLAMHIYMRKRIVAVAQERSPSLFVVNQQIPPVLPFTTKNNSGTNFVSQQLVDSPDNSREECSPRIDTLAPPPISLQITNEPSRRNSRPRSSMPDQLVVVEISRAASAQSTSSRLSEAILCQSTTTTTTSSSSPQATPAVPRRRNTPSPPNQANITPSIPTLAPNSPLPQQQQQPLQLQLSTSTNSRSNEAKLRRLALAALSGPTLETVTIENK